MKQTKIILFIAYMYFNLAGFSQPPKQAIDYFAKGNIAHDTRNYAAAIDNYTKAIKVNPEHTRCYFERAQCYFATGKYGPAIQDFSKAIALDKDPYYIYNYRAEAYTKNGNYELALADYDLLIEKNEASEDTYIGRADIYRRLKKYDLALEDCKKAISMNPIPGYVGQGLLYDAMRQYDLAIASATSAIEISNNNPDLYNNRAYYYGRKGVYDSAIIDFTKAITLKPDFPNPYSGRGRTYFSLGEYGKAITDLKKAISLNKTYDYAFLNIIFPLSRLHLFNEAAVYFNQYRKLGSADSLDYPGWNYVRYYIRAACVSIPKGNFGQAMKEIQLAEEYCLQQTEDKNATEASYYSSVLALKGYVYERHNWNEEARDAYKQSLVINPNQPDIKEALTAIEKKLSLIVEQDKMPPDIELISPQPTRSFDIESDNGTTQLTGRAKDESGIANVKINGKEIDKVEEDGLFMTNLTIKPGANTITIVATDKQGNTATKTFTINGTTVVNNNVKEPDIPLFTDQPPKYFALLIAEKDYQDPGMPDLENPVRDARDLKNILEGQYTFNKENIDSLYNRSREEIMEKIVWRCNTLTDNDNLIIFYAGHGIAVKDKFGDYDGYLIPVSARKGIITSYISASEIYIALKQSNAKHILFIADACFSGALLRSNRGLPDEANFGIQKQYKMSSRKAMASGNLEPVPDNSKFIYYLKKTLSENREKYVSARAVFNSFYDAINNNTATLPQYGAIMNVGDEGGEFIFIKK